jgi:hypothetical protein
LISAALVAANIIDGDGRRIIRIQNLVDFIPLQIRRTCSLADTLFASLAVLRFRTRLLRFFELRCNVACPRPDGSDSRSRRLRPLARPRNDECGCGVRTAEGIRCPAHALLSGEHAGQQCGERRRGMLEARGGRPDSGAAVLVGAVRL